MADSSRTRGAFASDCEGEGGERGKRGHRGHRGHQGATGPTGPAAPTTELANFFPYSVQTFTIFARIGGSDVTGDGSLANPFASFQRAIAQVAVDTGGIIPNGKSYVVDVTGLGVETLPDGYQFPVILGPTTAATFDDPSTFPFRASASLTVRAFPQPASNVPLADTTVPAGDIVSIVDDPSSGLAVITTATARASWAADALKGKFLIGDVAVGGANSSSAIYSSDPTHLLVANTSSRVPVQDLAIVEPSTTLQTSNPDINGAGIECVASNSIAFDGLAFRCLNPDPLAWSLFLAGAIQPFLELCDIEGVSFTDCQEQVFLSASVVRNKNIDIEVSNVTPVKTLFTNCNFFFGEAHGFLSRFSVFDATQGSIGPSPVFAGSGASWQGSWEFIDVLIQNSAAPSGALAAANGGWALETVAINGTIGGDAIAATGNNTQVTLTGVSGSGNTGFGVRTDNGAHVQADSTTTIGNADGRAYVNGNNAPATSWPGVPFNDVDPSTFSRVFEP